MELASATPLDGQENSNFRTAVGKLIFMAPWRRDMQLAIQQLSTPVLNPTTESKRAVKQLIRYLKDTQHTCLRLEPREMVQKGLLELDSRNDSERQSVMVYHCDAQNVTMCNRSLKQTAISLSSCEAEFYAASACAGELLGLAELSVTQRLFNDGGLSLYSPSVGIQLNFLQHKLLRGFWVRGRVVVTGLYLSHLTVLCTVHALCVATLVRAFVLQVFLVAQECGFLFFFADDVHCLLQRVTGQPYLSCEVCQFGRFFFFFFHEVIDPITRVRKAKFLTDVGDLPFECHCTALQRLFDPKVRATWGALVGLGWNTYQSLVTFGSDRPSVETLASASCEAW